jgi:hypothetical protein
MESKAAERLELYLHTPIYIHGLMLKTKKNFPFYKPLANNTHK